MYPLMLGLAIRATMNIEEKLLMEYCVNSEYMPNSGRYSWVILRFANV